MTDRRRRSRLRDLTGGLWVGVVEIAVVAAVGLAALAVAATVLWIL